MGKATLQDIIPEVRTKVKILYWTCNGKDMRCSRFEVRIKLEGSQVGSGPDRGARSCMS